MVPLRLGFQPGTTSLSPPVRILDWYVKLPKLYKLTGSIFFSVDLRCCCKETRLNRMLCKSQNVVPRCIIHAVAGLMLRSLSTLACNPMSYKASSLPLTQCFSQQSWEDNNPLRCHIFTVGKLRLLYLIIIRKMNPSERFKVAQVSGRVNWIRPSEFWVRRYLQLHFEGKDLLSLFCPSMREEEEKSMGGHLVSTRSPPGQGPLCTLLTGAHPLDHFLLLLWPEPWDCSSLRWTGIWLTTACHPSPMKLKHPPYPKIMGLNSAYMNTTV